MEPPKGLSGTISKPSHMLSTSLLLQEALLDYNAVASADTDSKSQGSPYPTSAPVAASLLRVCERRDGVAYVGRLAIGPGIVGYGSSGTLVFEGSLDGRPVAVKRVLRQVRIFSRTIEYGATNVVHISVFLCMPIEADNMGY